MYIYHFHILNGNAVRLFIRNEGVIAYFSIYATEIYGLYSIYL